MRIGVIGVFHETNTFAPGVTELSHFQSEWVEGELAFFDRYSGSRTSMGGAIDGARDNGAKLVAGLYAGATPGGIVTNAAAEAIMDSLIGSIAPGLDGLLVILHGAMVSEAYPDMEGELLARIRHKVGPGFPVAITVDLHANMSERLAGLADLIVGYDTYPHVDAHERAVEAIELLIRTIRGEIRPVVALSQPRLLVVPQAMTTSEGAMRMLIERAFVIERRAGVLNVTVLGGFPYSDVADAGMAFAVTADGDPALAQACADELSELAWTLRERFRIAGMTPKEAVTAAMGMPAGPVVLAEGSDNVGGGAPADATHVLREIAQAPCRSLIVIRDEEAALEAHRIGAGATFRGRIGGKADRRHGEPVMIEGAVRLLSDGRYRHLGPYMTGQLADMGRTAVIEAGPLTVVLTEKRQAPWDIGHIQSLGLRPEDYRIVVAKSAVAWKTAFGPAAKAEIQVDSPGCCSFNLSHFQYGHLRRPMFPLDEIADWRFS